MKTILLVLFLVLSCNSKDKKGEVFSLDPDLDNGVWVRGYTLDSANLEDRLAIVRGVVAAQTVCISCGMRVINEETWRITATGSDTANIITPNGAFNARYEINGSYLELYFDDGDHHTYTR